MRPLDLYAFCHPRTRWSTLVTVTDSVVAAVLDPYAGLALQVPVTWKGQPGTVRAQMAVSNVHALPVRDIR